MNAGIILAGGASERLRDYGTPKQFIEINGLPLMMYCLGAFENCDDIDSYVITAPEDKHEDIRSWVAKCGGIKLYDFALPGKTRQHSVYNALLVLKTLSPQYVIIHDAVRPLITRADISQLLSVVKESGSDGATPALPLNETVYQSTDGTTVTGLLARDELKLGQTPECYDFEKYIKAHEALSGNELGHIRGSSEIAYRAGMKINLSMGNLLNIKVTTARDLVYFKYMLDNTDSRADEASEDAI